MTHMCVRLSWLNRLIVLCLLLLAGVNSVSYAQNEKEGVLPIGFYFNPNGKIMASDSVVASYFFDYGAGGALRSGIENTPSNLEALSRLVQIPVLVSEKYSRTQALDNFTRSVKFNISGIDPKGEYTNESGQGGNIPLPKNIIKEYLSKEGGIEELFNYQLKIGNYLIVDRLNNLPLYLKSEKGDLNFELQKYRNMLVYWAAAYPWAFYELSNIALKEAILQNRDLYPLSLFLKHRFQFDEEFLQQVNSRMWIVNN